ncbi:hypothetical protein [Microvirga sesbaniae]|uniref:hypothetical protein n=1 Tax=Microvirga sesbaniae TaxID=681392 RepID=UPI0021C86DB0|nr:hypothetical protein [Microvirga sp. HBU67692]
MALTLNLLTFTRPTGADIIERQSLSLQGAWGNDQSFRAKFTPDGRYSVFYSLANNLVPNDSNNQIDIFRKDLKSGEIIRVSTNAGGLEIDTGVPTQAYDLDISPDGRYVLFSTESGHLGPGDQNGLEDVYMKDLVTQAITRISTGTRLEPNSGSVSARFSPDGKYVVFGSLASNLIPTGDNNGENDIFRRNLATGQIDRISVGPQGQESVGGSSWDAKYTPDGRYVIFSSIATSLIPYSGTAQILRKDVQTGALDVLSTNAAGQPGTHHSLDAQISADGRYLIFASHARNLVPNDTNEAYDIFRKDLQTGVVERVSVSRTGEQSNGDSRAPQISPDGRYVVFESKGKNLVPNDTNDAQDIFRKDMLTGEIVRLSATATGTQGQGSAAEADSYNPRFSADGRFVSFDSFSGLVPFDNTGVRDVFVVDTLLKDNFGAVNAQQFVELSFDVGQASSVSIAWGDGTSSTVQPAGGVASFTHSYATAGTKTAVVTVNEGGQTWSVSYAVDLASGRMTRNATTDTQTGNTGADVLTGDASGNILSGGSGNDALNGLEGDDRLMGGPGKDLLTGGSGMDVFVFDSPVARKKNANIDKLADFSARDDSIWLDNAVFKGLGRKGSIEKPAKLSKAAFYKGEAAHDASDRIVVSKSGKIYYDADGTGSQAKIHIATVPKAAVKAMAHGDFFVI